MSLPSNNAMSHSSGHQWSNLYKHVIFTMLCPVPLYGKKNTENPANINLIMSASGRYLQFFLGTFLLPAMPRHQSDSDLSMNLIRDSSSRERKRKKERRGGFTQCNPTTHVRRSLESCCSGLDRTHI